MFPHTITIYHHDIYNNNDRYIKYIVEGVYLNENKGITRQGNGIVNSNEVTVITPKSVTNSYGTIWNVENGDRIIKGRGTDITKWSDLANAYSVTSIKENICGSNLDNIVIKGV